MTKRRGPRRDGTDTRQAILDAARAGFAAHGYDRTTIRAVARAAGVDPAMVHHWFGDKRGLFVASVDLRFDPAVLLARVLEERPETAGRTMVLAFLGEIDRDPSVPVSLLRAAATSDTVAELVRGFFAEGAARALRARYEPEEAALRANLAFSQLVGLLAVRRIVGAEPLASMPVEAVADAVAPTVQRYLTGALSD